MKKLSLILFLLSISNPVFSQNTGKLDFVISIPQTTEILLLNETEQYFTFKLLSNHKHCVLFQQPVENYEDNDILIKNQQLCFKNKITNKIISFEKNIKNRQNDIYKI